MHSCDVAMDCHRQRSVLANIAPGPDNWMEILPNQGCTMHKGLVPGIRFLYTAGLTVTTKQPEGDYRQALRTRGYRGELSR